MRLNPIHSSAIRDAVSRHFKGRHKLFLYGSRADDSLKGGDIDLLILTDAADVDALSSCKYRILGDIKSKIGDQRIDFLIKGNADEDPFLREILATAVLLNES